MEDRRLETESMRQLHEKMDKALKCLYGDPADAESVGIKGIVSDNCKRIGYLEGHRNRQYAFVSAAGLLAIGSLIKKFWP